MAVDTSRGPYDRPTIEIFFNQYKQYNPRVDFSVNQIYLSDIGLNIDPQTRHAVNTQAYLKGKESAGQSGTQRVRFNRRDIGKVFAKCKVYVPYAGQAMLSELLESINSRYPIQLARGDIYDANLPEHPTLPLELTIPMHANNPAFIGAITLTLGA